MYILCKKTSNTDSLTILPLLMTLFLKSKSSLNFYFFRFNYQRLWEQQDQQAYIHFPQILTQTEFLPYIIQNEHRHLQYRDPTSFNTTYFEQITTL